MNDINLDNFDNNISFDYDSYRSNLHERDISDFHNISNISENVFNIHSIKDNILNKLQEKRLEDINKLKNEDKRCTICLDDFIYKDVVIYLPCFHLFHKNCIFKWLKKNAICPLCKLNINQIMK